MSFVFIVFILVLSSLALLNSSVLCLRILGSSSRNELPEEIRGPHDSHRIRTTEEIDCGEMRRGQGWEGAHVVRSEKEEINGTDV